ncbi:MAG: alpha/beta fold hydrolase [Prochlorococcaceae cyanobacterium]
MAEALFAPPLRWDWQGFSLAYCHAPGPKGASTPQVLLVHGFGANRQHWRYTLNALSAVADVWAIDLLGFGASSKPRSQLAGEPEQAGAVRYGFDLWAEQLCAFCETVIGQQAPGAPLHLVGNSIGAVVCLNTARLLVERGQAPAGLVLIDCAQRTLDDKRAAQLPLWEQATRPLVKQLVRRRWLLAALFRSLARPPFIRQVLLRAYPSGANVDDALVQLLHGPSTEAGALESFRGFVNLFNDHLAPELLARLCALAPELPVRLLWGEADPWEDPEEARQWAAAFPCIDELIVLSGLGHCPHDEAPEQVNPILMRWITGNA